MIIRILKATIITSILGATITSFTGTDAIAQQVQSNRTSGSFPIVASSSCPKSFEKILDSGNQHDPNYTGPDKVFLCVPKKPGKLIEKARDNPLASTSLPFLSLDSFGALKTDISQDPVRQELTSQEEANLSQFLSGLNFSEYLLSGCNDRAHAAYMMLPEDLKNKALKIWVASPGVYTRGVVGLIGLKNDDSVSWGYHVALAFQTKEGLKVYDAGLAPGVLLKEQDWFDLAIYPPLSFKTFTPGKAYLFFNEDDDVTKLNNQKDWVLNKDIWTGEYYEYLGDAVANNTIPNALARDAVGQRVESAQACNDLMATKGFPDLLLSKLQAKDYDPVECALEASLFASSLADWTVRLK
ncbi:MAG: protein-glutamine glutaminase family protein [Litorimonas sp.]